MNRHFQPFPPLPPCEPEPCCKPISGCSPVCEPLCTPEKCRCDRCGRPEPRPKPFPPNSFLLPRILAAGRIWLRRTPFCLKLTELDPCAQPPYTLLSVDVGSAAPHWEACTPDRGPMVVRVWVPLCCRVKDGCGNVFTAHAEAEAEVPLRLTTPPAECWRSTLVVLPSVRLVCVPQPSDTACITAQLELLIEAYLTRWESCMAGVPKPVSPNG